MGNLCGLYHENQVNASPPLPAAAHQPAVHPGPPPVAPEAPSQVENPEPAQQIADQPEVEVDEDARSIVTIDLGPGFVYTGEKPNLKVGNIFPQTKF